MGNLYGPLGVQAARLPQAGGWRCQTPAWGRRAACTPRDRTGFPSESPWERGQFARYDAGEPPVLPGFLTETRDFDMT